MKFGRNALAFGRVLLLTGMSLAILGVAYLANRFPIVGCASNVPESVRLCVAEASIWFTVAGIVMATVGVVFILKSPKGITSSSPEPSAHSSRPGPSFLVNFLRSQFIIIASFRLRRGGFLQYELHLQSFFFWSVLAYSWSLSPVPSVMNPLSVVVGTVSR